MAKARWGDVGIGLGTVVLAIVLAWQTTLIPGGGSYARVGADVFPWYVSILLGVLGAILVVMGVLGWGPAIDPDAEDTPAIDRQGAIFISLGLLANIALIDVAGFIVSSTILFVCTARAFHSTAPLRDAAIGFALAFVAYIGFDRVLGYKIGSGLIESLI